MLVVQQSTSYKLDMVASPPNSRMQVQVLVLVVWCGVVVGVPGLAAASSEIPCSLVVPPGRHQFASQSQGWMWVCGTEKSGV